jgi:tol-pal system protein YbgF
MIQGLKWVMVCTVLTCTSLQAAIFEDEEARRAILDLRQRVESLRQAQQAGDQNLQKSLEQAAQSQKASEQEVSQYKQSLLQLQSQIDGLKQELSGLRGEREELLREISLLQRSQKEILANVETRLKNVDQRFDKFEPVTVQIDGLEFEAEQSEKKDFDASLAIFRKGEFAAAATSFASFLRKYPSSGYRPSALYWLGSANYINRDYLDTVNQLKAFLVLSPNHQRVAEALLTLGNAQLETKQPKDAKKTLEDLVKQFPNTEAASAAKERLAKLK